MPDSVQMQFDPPCNNDEYQHINVLIEAFDLFRDRSLLRGDMWRKFPARDKVRELRERVTRIETALNMVGYSQTLPEGHRAGIRSDAVDIINYAAFLVKQIDEGAEL